MYLVVWSLLGIAFIVGCIFLVVKIKGLISRVNKQVEDVSTKVRTTADHITTTANTITDRAERISETVETTVRDVAHKADVTTDVLRDAIAAPVINVSALATGIRKGIETWVEKRRARRDDEGD